MDENKVSVRIYGQEYTIAGDESREHIMKVADYVDDKMHEIGGHMNAPLSSIAVLTAINAASDYFGLIEENEALKVKAAELENDTKHYIQLWEEAKRSFSQYQEDAKTANEENVRLKEDLANKNEECKLLLAEKDREIAELKRTARGLENKIVEASGNQESIVNDRIKELESTCFDLEMENVQMKAELDRLKKQL